MGNGGLGKGPSDRTALDDRLVLDYNNDMAHILVVDDDPDLLVLLDAHYRVRGHQVATAPCCQEGLEAAAAKRPDLILLDFCLPKMDGGRFLEILRSDSLTREVPVLIMSAASSGWIATRLPTDPFVRLIDKPFDFESLDPLVLEMIGAERR